MRVFIKYKEFNNGIITDKQIKGKIIEENETYSTVEFILNGKKETKAIQNNEISTTPHVIEYGI